MWYPIALWQIMHSWVKPVFSREMAAILLRMIDSWMSREEFVKFGNLLI